MAAALLAVIYPFFIYFGLTRFGARQVALLALALLALRAGLAAGSLTRSKPAGRLLPLARKFAPVLALLLFGWLTGDRRFLLALPVAVNIALLVVFLRSLREPKSIVERFARLRDSDLSAAEVRYCESVTRVWCGFFALNAAVSAALVLAAPLSWWALYTGLLAYLAMGLLFAAEFSVRRHRFRRFGNGAADRVLRRLYEGRENAKEQRGTGTWMSAREKGSVFGVRLILFVSKTLGRRPVHAAMRVVAAYYLATDAAARRASREFLQRVGVRPTLAAVYRHIRCFAFCATDRIFFLRGDTHLFQITRVGREHVDRLRQRGQGAILIGAHFGSYEALRAVAETDDVPLSIVAWFENTGISYSVYESLAPELASRVIPLQPGKPDTLLEVRRRVAAGELVAFLGDRAIPGGETVEVDFLGRPARFPTGAFSVAAALGCPVLLVFNVFREPNRYELHCEPFADRIDWTRRGDTRRKVAVVQRYATRLEEYVRNAPLNWFNFYPFWD